MVTGETPCAQVAPVVGEQQLVHPAEGERGVARKHGAEDVADEPEELQGFGERLRGTLCDGVAARGGFVQAGAPSGAGIPAGVGLEGLIDADGALEEVEMVLRIPA